jgi:ATP-dependent DNA ligase
LQTEAENHAKFVVTGTALAYLPPAMKTNPLPTGLVVPAQPVKAPKPPVGTGWVHEIKYDDYRFIVRRDGPTCGFTAATPVTGLCDWRRSRLPPS